MKNINKIIALFVFVTVFTSCDTGDNKADGYGNFEATETIISAESNGKLLAFNVDEGAVLRKGTSVGYVDTTQLALKKQQILATKSVINAKSQGVLSQINVLKAQLRTAKVSKERVQNLINENAGTQKQLDDINGKIDVLNQQVNSIRIQNASVINEFESLDVQLRQIEDQLIKSEIINPLDGTVLVKYAEPFEITNFGKPLYKIADLSTMQLRVFVSETQLTSINIGQKVTVKVDEVNGMKSYSGNITWIASEAEFTPKIIQTKEERVSLVYAVKIDVINDGGLKIGMPAEMWISNQEN